MLFHIHEDTVHHVCFITNNYCDIPPGEITQFIYKYKVEEHFAAYLFVFYLCLPIDHFNYPQVVEGGGERGDRPGTLLTTSS